MASLWFVYTGSSTPSIQFLYPSNYLQGDSISIGFCSLGSVPCAIYARNGVGKPLSFSANLKAYILSGFVSFTSQPVTSGKKIYLYVKSGF